MSVSTAFCVSVGPTSRHCKWVSLSTRLVETVSVVTRTNNTYTQRERRVLFRAYFADRFGDLSRDLIYVNDACRNGRCRVGVLTYVEYKSTNIALSQS